MVLPSFVSAPDSGRASNELELLQGALCLHTRFESPYAILPIRKTFSMKVGILENVGTRTSFVAAPTSGENDLFEPIAMTRYRFKSLRKSDSGRLA
jgi:hypothetical protein